MKKIPIAKPSVGFAEILEVFKVLRSGNLSQGPRVLELEQKFSSYMEDRPCVAVNSGTSALHLALISLGIGVGDEVIVPSFTFAASANAIKLSGATPVFVDIDLDTFNLSIHEIELKITSKTRAIMAVHMFGLPAPMIAISQIAKKHNLLVIEDAAQAHLSSIDGKMIGTFSDAAAFSFYPTKNMTTGEGGMIVFSDQSAERTARLLRNQGMEIRYRNEIVGFNLRMSDIHAAIGIHQLRRLPIWNERRIRNAEILSNLIDHQLLVTPITPTGYRHVFHQYTVRILHARDQISNSLTRLGIGNAVYYPTQVHRLPSFDSDISLPMTAVATEQVLSLPVHPNLRKTEVKRVARCINEVAQQYE